MMSKRMPFAGYGDTGGGSLREPGAGPAKRTRTMSPMTSGGGQPGGGGASAPRVPPASPLPPDIDLTALMGDTDATSAPLTPATAGAYTQLGGEAEDASPMPGLPGGLSSVLQMILRSQGGRA